MIWVDGRIVRDEELKVSVTDRTFEHGLGLFETLRTYRSVAPLLDRHLARMTNSARALGLPIDSVRLPDENSVLALLKAEGVLAGDRMLRITLSGGLSVDGGSMLWMRAFPLPPSLRRSGMRVEIGRWVVPESETLARHKTLNYWSRRQAHESAQRLGFDEILSQSPGGSIWEGSRTNLFVFDGHSFLTPSLEGPIVPGIMRSLVIAQAKALGLNVREVQTLTEETLLAGSDEHEVFLTNSVRGIIPVERVGNIDLKVPGQWTKIVETRVNEVIQGLILPIFKRNVGRSLGETT